MKKLIHTEGRKFMGPDGSEILLHGINMVCKDSSLGHIGNYTGEDLKYLKSLGMNVIRLGIYWESLEPEPGRYDDDYLNKLKKIVELASKEDIYVFLDMHQDLYGAKFEDGAPDWATLDEELEHLRTELWSESYLISPAVQKSFDNFWSNKPASDGVGLMDHFAMAWQHVAGFFADNPYVIGYDLFNEPFPGSRAAAILPVIGELMEKLENGTAGYEDLFKGVSEIEKMSGPFEEEVLNPFYEKMAEAVREKDPECILFLETNYFSNASVPTHVRPVLKNGQPVKNQALAPHGYDIFVDTDMYESTDNSRVDLIFKTHFEIAKALDMPMLVGEWGCYPDAVPVQIEQAKHILGNFKRLGISDTYFDFSHLYGNPVTEALKR